MCVVCVVTRPRLAWHVHSEELNVVSTAFVYCIGGLLCV